MGIKLNGLLAAGALLLGNAAHAAIDGTLTFVTPTATIRSTDVVEVWGRLALSATSDALTYDSSAPSYGLSALPEFGHFGSTSYFGDTEPFASYTSSFLVVGRTCAGNFTDGCGPAQYTGNQSNSSWFSIDMPFAMNPGDSRDFLLATYTPTDGTAADGTYSASGEFWLGIGVKGLDIHGNELQSYAVKFSTCPSEGPDCLFTRTVSTVPVPAAAWLFGSGILGLAGMSRRRAAQA
jgi:hypothetical protein